MSPASSATHIVEVEKGTRLGGVPPPPSCRCCRCGPPAAPLEPPGAGGGLPPMSPMALVEATWNSSSAIRRSIMRSGWSAGAGVGVRVGVGARVWVSGLQWWRHTRLVEATWDPSNAMRSSIMRSGWSVGVGSDYIAYGVSIMPIVYTVYPYPLCVHSMHGLLWWRHTGWWRPRGTTPPTPSEGRACGLHRTCVLV